MRDNTAQRFIAAYDDTREDDLSIDVRFIVYFITISKPYFERNRTSIILLYVYKSINHHHYSVNKCNKT